MTDKIRRVDFSPAEFLEGVSDLTVSEIGCYWVVCSLIYARGGPVEDDPLWIGRAAGCGYRSARHLVDRLVSLGKLARTPDGRLTNGRAEFELTRASRRVASARANAERAAEAHRDRSRTVAGPYPNRSRNVADAHSSIGVSSENNDLAEPGGSEPSTINHQPPKSKKESARSNERASRARKATDAEQQLFPIENGVDHGDEQRHRLARDWRPSEGQREFAESLGLETDATAEAFVLWWVEGKGRREQRTDSGWGLTWKGWCRRDAERGGRGATTRNGSGVRPAGGGGIAGAALRFRARNREQ